MGDPNHSLDVRHHDKLEISATWGPIVIRLVDGAVTEPADIERVRVWMDELLQQWPTIGMLTIAHHGTPVTSFSTARYSKQRIANIEERLVIGVALLGLGFWAQAGRAAVEMFSRLVNRSSTLMVGNSVESVVDRMALELVGLDRDRLCVACAELERRFRAGE